MSASRSENPASERARRRYSRVLPPLMLLEATAHADKLSDAGTEPYAGREHTVVALGRGLRQWHDDLPVSQCSYRWDVRTRLDGRGMLRTPVGYSFLEAATSVENDLVVCHGDACNPNFLVRDGAVVGYVDLGHLGVGDRWADLAPALMSLGWNFGRGWERIFLDAYGVRPDAGKLDYYSRLWDLA